MAQTDYEKAKADCWDTFKILGGCEEVITKKDAFNYAFSKAYALGKQEKDGEEMLSVSRKRVQEMFTEAQKSVPSCEYDRGFRGAELTILRNLFGSKCLPDNVDTSAPNVDSSHGNVDNLDSNVESLSQKSSENCDNEKHISNNPAKPKFKVGDKVMYKGVVRVIDLIDTVTHRYHLSNGNYYAEWVDESDLGPYTKPEGNTSPNVSHSDIDIDELVAKGYLPDPAKQFDTILKDSFSKERRLNIATTIAAALAVDYYHESYGESNKWQRLAKLSMTIADALIAEAEKGSSNAEPIK